MCACLLLHYKTTFRGHGVDNSAYLTNISIVHRLLPLDHSLGANPHPGTWTRSAWNTVHNGTGTHARTHARMHTHARTHGRTHGRARTHAHARSHARTHARARTRAHTHAWDWYTSGTVHTRTGAQQGQYIPGLMHNGTSTQWD